MSLPRYPKYKDSGVEWIGEVPEHWELTPLKHLADFINGDAFKPSEWSESGTPIIRIQNLNGSEEFNFYDGTIDDRYLVRSGDLLFGWSGNRGTSFGPFLWSAEGLYALNQHIFRVAPRSVLKNVLYWMLKAVTAHVEDQAHGIIGMVHITKEDLGSINVPLPPQSERAAVAEFLTAETAKIDALVEEQRRLIELLKEKRQAVISHAVTKGLNPHAPMKDSGIEWIGQIPAHWEVKPFRSCIDFQEGPGIMAVDFQESGIPLLRVSSVQDRWATLDGCNYLSPDRVTGKWKHFRLSEGDLLISASASMGTVCEVGPEIAGAIPYTGLIRLRGIDRKMIKSYVRHLVVSNQFSIQIDLLKAGATIQHFGPTHLSQMTIARPPVEEQIVIAMHIDRENARLDSLVAEATHAIDLLQERRTALISAAVTGKINVRGLATEDAA